MFADSGVRWSNHVPGLKAKGDSYRIWLTEVSWEQSSALGAEAGPAPGFPGAGTANPSPGTVPQFGGVARPCHIHVGSVQYLSAQGPEQFPVHQPARRGGQHLPRLAERMRWQCVSGSPLP